MCRRSPAGFPPIRRKRVCQKAKQRVEQLVTQRCREGLRLFRDLSPDELRKEWRRLYRSQPPRLSRDLLVRAIAYRIQELRYGGLSKATRRKLAALVQARRSDDGDRPRGRAEDQSGRAVGA